MLTSPFPYTSDKFQWDGRKADSYAAPVDTENKVATIASAEEPALFKYEVTDQKVDCSGYTAEITKDIDLGSGFWRPIDPVNNLTINGNGHTIRNLLIYTCTIPAVTALRNSIMCRSPTVSSKAMARSAASAEWALTSM